MRKRIHSICPVIGKDLCIKLLVLCFCLLISAILGCGQKEADAVCIGDLRTEYRENPIDIDAENRANGVYVWDSGRVESGNAVDIRYAGEPLEP